MSHVSTRGFGRCGCLGYGTGRGEHPKPRWNSSRRDGEGTPEQERGTGAPLGAGARWSQALPTGRKSDSRRERTVINKIIIRNKPRALAERRHCHAGTAYPAPGSLARQTWGCSRSPNHTHPGQGRGEASGNMARAEGTPAATPSGAESLQTLPG